MATITSGGNSIGADLAIGTTDAYDLDLIVSGSTRLCISASGGIGIGNNSPAAESLSIYHATGGTSSWTGLSTSLVVTSAGSTPNGYQQGAYVQVRADHDTGTLDLLRNYLTAEMSGDGVVTETYGARAISRLFDYNAGDGDTASGKIIHGYGLEAYVGNVSTGGGVIRNAVGIYISRAHATGTESGETHEATGLRIDNIVASGGSTNDTYSIKSTTPAKSWFEGDVWVRDGKALRLYRPDSAYYSGFQVASSATANALYTLPDQDGSPGQVLGTNGSKVLSWQSPGGVGDLVDGGNATGFDVSVGSNDDNDLILKSNGASRAWIKAAGPFLVGDDGTNLESKCFGAHYYESSDNNKPSFEFQSSFGYYASSSSSRVATSYSYNVRPGDDTHVYSGEHIGMASDATLGTGGSVSSLNGISTRVSNISSTGIINSAVGGLYRVVNSGGGIVRKATGVEVSRIDATGTDTFGHEASGLRIAYDGNTITASGSIVSNKATGIQIGDGISASGTGAEAWAIECLSTAPSKFVGQVKAESGVQVATTATRPTASAALRGTLWSVRGGTGVADTVEICVKLADDSYSWVSVL